MYRFDDEFPPEAHVGGGRGIGNRTIAAVRIPKILVLKGRRFVADLRPPFLLP